MHLNKQITKRALLTVLSMGCQYRNPWFQADSVRTGKADYEQVLIQIVYDVGQINEPTYSSTQIKMDLCIVSDLLRPCNAVAEQKKA